MELKLLRGNSSVGEANLHLQLMPKYRKAIFQDEVIKKTCEETFKQVADQLHVGLAGIGFGPDHCHLFVTGWKNYSIPEIAKRFKGATARTIRQKCWPRVRIKLWGKAFWSGGYFYRTVGAVSNEAMLKYVTESQQKHWNKTAPQPTTQQTTLLQCW